jgi:hypothetical protein
MGEKAFPKKHFTVQQANAMLPLVRSIAADLSALARDLRDRRERLGHLLAGRQFDERDPYDAELMQVEEELRRDAGRLGHYVNELRELGVEPKDGPDGLVDFPSLRDGRLVYLCWKLDEPRVAFWHEVDAGFAGRQPLRSVDLPPEATDAQCDAVYGDDHQHEPPLETEDLPRIATEPGTTASHGTRLNEGSLTKDAKPSGQATSTDDVDPLQRGNRPVKFGLGPEQAEP